MIQILEGNLLDADVEAYVNPVNCVGVMGKGLALQMKKAFRLNFDYYARACATEELSIGQVYISETKLQKSNPKYIINFPTKNHWREHSKLAYITEGLKSLERRIEELNIKSIAIPALGCGLGGLEWSQVLPKIEEVFLRLPAIEVFLFRPK